MVTHSKTKKDVRNKSIIFFIVLQRVVITHVLCRGGGYLEGVQDFLMHQYGLYGIIIDASGGVWNQDESICKILPHCCVFMPAPMHKNFTNSGWIDWGRDFELSTEILWMFARLLKWFASWTGGIQFSVFSVFSFHWFIN